MRVVRGCIGGVSSAVQKNKFSKLSFASRVYLLCRVCVKGLRRARARGGRVKILKTFMWSQAARRSRSPHVAAQATRWPIASQMRRRRCPLEWRCKIPNRLPATARQMVRARGQTCPWRVSQGLRTARATRGNWTCLRDYYP